MNNKYKLQIQNNYCTGPSTKSSFNDKKSEQRSSNCKLIGNCLQIKDQSDNYKENKNAISLNNNNINHNNHRLLHYHNHRGLYQKKDIIQTQSNSISQINKIHPRIISREYRFKSVNKSHNKLIKESKLDSRLHTEVPIYDIDFKEKLKTLESLLKELASFNSQRLNKEIEAIYIRAMKIKAPLLYNNTNNDSTSKSNDILLAKKIIELDEKYTLIKKENKELKVLIDKKMADYDLIYREFNALNALFGKQCLKETKLHKKNSVSTDYKMPQIPYFKNNNQTKKDDDLLQLDTVDLLNRYHIKGAESRKYLYYEPKVKMTKPRIKTAIPKLNISELNDSNELFNSFIHQNNDDQSIENIEAAIEDTFAYISNMTVGDINNQEKSYDKIKNKEQVFKKPIKSIKNFKSHLL